MDILSPQVALGSVLVASGIAAVARMNHERVSSQQQRDRMSLDSVRDRTAPVNQVLGDASLRGWNDKSLFGMRQTRPHLPLAPFDTEKNMRNFESRLFQSQRYIDANLKQGKLRLAGGADETNPVSTFGEPGRIKKRHVRPVPIETAPIRDRTDPLITGFAELGRK